MKRKTIMLSVGLAVLLALPTMMSAQSDREGSLFGSQTTKQNPSGLMNRTGDPVNVTGSISNYGIGEDAPLGSGLLILTMAGAGYAALRRKRSRKGIALLLAGLLLLGFTQCKKEQPVVQNEGVHITLRVDGVASANSPSSDGPRVNVNPTGNGTYATVDYEDGDIIYVGNGGQYCGTLTCTSSGSDYVFEGEINPTSTDDFLHFYLLGGKGFTPTVSGNTATVNISNQSVKYPVVSYAPSTEKYTSGTTQYSAKLFNKVSIMKFNVTTTIASKSCVCIDGMYNTVTVDFTNPNGSTNGFSYSKSGVGQIMMPGGNGTETSFTTWAIVLPQGDLPEAVGKVYINGYKGTRPAISEISSNQYLNDGVNLTIDSQTDELIGLFSISSTKQVHFSKGNLQAVGTTTSSPTSGWTWQFAAHQYDFIGNAAANNAVSGNGTISTDGTVDLFGWSTSSTYYGINLSTSAGDYSGTFKDWGENKIGGSEANYWRTLSSAEWQYIVGEDSYRTGCGTVAGVENALCTKATVNGKIGFILFPDIFSGGPTGIDWQTNYIGHGGMSNSGTTGWGTTIDLTNWEALENEGCVFLPVAYVRYDKRMIYYTGCPFGGDYTVNKGFYSSNTSRDANTIYTLRFSDAGYDPNEYFNRSYGYSVRLVHDVE